MTCLKAESSSRRLVYITVPVVVLVLVCGLVYVCHNVRQRTARYLRLADLYNQGVLTGTPPKSKVWRYYSHAQI